MKIGIVVGELESGKFETIGDIGDMVTCKARFNKVFENKGVVKSGKTSKKYVKIILSDMNRDALRTRKC